MEVYKREYPPAHYSLKVEGFSLLSKAEEEKYETGIFEAGGYKWSLCLYPDGDKKFDGEGHVSIYLVIQEIDKLDRGWEINVNFRILVLDQRRNIYLTVQDGEVRRFHELKRKWGFPQLIFLDTLRDASNGYLMDDTCIFGAEVFLMKPLSRSDSLTMTMEVIFSNKYTWRLDHFTKMDKSFYDSDPFHLGGRNWKITIYPKGDNRANGKYLTVFLELVGAKDLPPKTKLYARCKLRVLDQRNKNHREHKFNHWFSHSAASNGYPSFMSLKELHNPGNGFAYKNTVIVEAEVPLIYEFKVQEGNGAQMLNE